MSNDFSIFAGDYATITAEIETTENLADYEAKFLVKKEVYSDELVIVKTTGELTIIGNTIHITLNSIDTKELEPGFYYHTIKMIDTNGEGKTVLTGNLTIHPSVD